MDDTNSSREGEELCGEIRRSSTLPYGWIFAVLGAEGFTFP